MIVFNRSDTTVSYQLPELTVRRSFVPGESKDLSDKELKALLAVPGGEELLLDYLVVKDKAWVEKNLGEKPEVEYFWGKEEILKCLNEDSLDDFTDTLVHGPAGVIDLIKTFAIQSLNDLGKIEAIANILHFDVRRARSILELGQKDPLTPTVEKRRRREA